MSDFIEIDHPPVIFDDSEHCKELKPEGKKCSLLDYNYSVCRLFKTKLENHFVSKSYSSFSYWRKCDECKIAWKKAKENIVTITKCAVFDCRSEEEKKKDEEIIKQNQELPEGDYPPSDVTHFYR